MSNDYFHAILKESVAEREKAERRGSRSVNSDFLQSLVSTKIASEEAAAERSQSGTKIRLPVEDIFLGVMTRRYEASIDLGALLSVPAYSLLTTESGPTGPSA